MNYEPRTMNSSIFKRFTPFFERFQTVLNGFFLPILPITNQPIMTFYAKQTQFAKCPNERKPFNNS